MVKCTVFIQQSLMRNETFGNFVCYSFLVGVTTPTAPVTRGELLFYD